MKTQTGVNGYPSFAVHGTNADLQRFEADCRSRGLAVSKANSYFRDDYEHCLMPCYAYDAQQPNNIKLQTMSADAYSTKHVFDLATDYESALSMVEVINQYHHELT